MSEIAAHAAGRVFVPGPVNAQAGDHPEIRLDVRGVGKFFGSRLVLRDVNVSARAGEALLVVGGNGAGKTTLLKIMAGLSRASAGAVDVRVEPEACAYLGHATFLYPRLSATANLTFWGRMYGLSPQRPGATRVRLWDAKARTGISAIGQAARPAPGLAPRPRPGAGPWPQ